MGNTCASNSIIKYKLQENTFRLPLRMQHTSMVRCSCLVFGRMAALIVLANGQQMGKFFFLLLHMCIAVYNKSIDVFLFPIDLQKIEKAYGKTKMFPFFICSVCFSGVCHKVSLVCRAAVNRIVKLKRIKLMILMKVYVYDFIRIRFMLSYRSNFGYQQRWIARHDGMGKHNASDGDRHHIQTVARWHTTQ